MFKEKIGFKGKVIVKVFNAEGNIKRHKPNLFETIFNLPGKEMISINHNIVTNNGDALIADMLATTPTQTAVDNGNGVIGVGTGFSAATKAVNALVTQTGSDEAMDATYPKQKGAYGAANDNVEQYVSTFEAGDLNASGIDEAALGNGVDLLAYAEISPSVNVTASDTLEVTWELTFLGS